MTPDQKRIEKLENTLKVIRTWASYYHDNFWTFQDNQHIKILRDIRDKCEELLKK